MEKTLHILLVDDSESSLAIVRTYLNKMDHVLTTCNNGSEAVEMFKARNFDLVLMDVMMPVMDGLEATIAIRSYERENQRHPTPIFLLSGNDTPAEITRYARAGINAFLPKPLDRSELLQAILTHTVQP